MRSTIQYIKSELADLLPETEIQAITRIILESVCGWSFSEQLTRANETMDKEKVGQITAIVHRLKKSEPIQYVLGETEFFGLKLKVNPAVLIPRPETEELVEWVCNSILPENPQILDVGTGSGCIALALKKNLKDAEISAVDFSEKALDVARQNAGLNNLKVEFLKVDILNWEKYEWDFFDVIVSNPPYVRVSEKKLMQKNVLDFEPGMALFVSDEDPLVFYREIARFAQNFLAEKGFLFFEINESLSDPLIKMLQQNNFTDIQLQKDLQGKNRMIRCRK